MQTVIRTTAHSQRRALWLSFVAIGLALGGLVVAATAAKTAADRTLKTS